VLHDVVRRALSGRVVLSQLSMDGRQRRGRTLIVFAGWVSAAVFDYWILANQLHWRAVFCQFESVLLSLLRTSCCVGA